MLRTILFAIIVCSNIVFSQEIQQQNLENTPKLQAGVSTHMNDTINTEEYIKVSLIDVVLETVAQSNNVKAAREKVRQAKIKLDDAYSGYLPSIDGTYKNARTKTKPGDDGDGRKFYNDESYKLSVTQNLYEGGATQTEINSLDKKYDVAKNDYRLVIAKEIENAVKAYFDVLFNFKSLNVNQENMERLQEILSIVNIKYDSGATSLGDLSNIKASVSNAESKLIKIESKFNEALEYYKYIVGDEFIKTFPYEDSFDTSIDDFDMIIDKAVKKNINLQTYKLNIESQKYKLLNAKSGFKPKVDLELSSERVTDQEDYEWDERNYKAQVVLSYNFYNKGRDKNKILTINSMIRELDYRYKEEVRKLKWTLSKLHRSIISVTNASVSTKAEVLASQEMVNAYWDGFKLGEQDLQELLQGQRQLNSAQLDLIANRKSAITDYFKLLSNTGELLKYFRLDIESDNFIDFTQSDYKNLLKTKVDETLTHDLATVQNKDAKVISMVIDTNTTDINATVQQEDENLTVVTETNTTISADNNITAVKDSLNDLLEFESKFLETADDKWTIRLFYFDKVYQALDFAKEKNIYKDIFVFDTLVDNTIKTNIAYNIFDTEALANASLNDFNTTNIEKKVSNIKDIKKIYNNFKNKKLQHKIKVKKVKAFQTSQLFKNKFLNADKDYYTINITSFSSMTQAKQLLEKEKIYDNSFVFLYGEEKEWVKVVYGVFKTYEEANSALEQLKNIKEKYEPVIEIIETKQNLYKQYNSYKKENTKVIDAKLQREIVTTDFNNTSDFQEVFLSTPAEYFTINLATLIDVESANKFKEKYQDSISLFVFKFGQDKTYYKAMSGVYTTKEEALQAIENLDEILKRNTPTVERVGVKQKLYFKYNSDTVATDTKLEEQ